MNQGCNYFPQELFNLLMYWTVSIYYFNLIISNIFLEKKSQPFMSTIITILSF